MSNKPETAKEILYSLPARLKTDKVSDDKEVTVHFDFSADDTGMFTAHLKNKQVVVSDGHQADADCLVSCKGSTYEDIELGRTNPQMAFMMGKIKISDLMVLMEFIGFFKRLDKEA